MYLNKPYLIYICYIIALLLTSTSLINAQQIYLKVNGANKNEDFFLKKNLNDSIFSSGATLENELRSLETKIKENGYFQYKQLSTVKKDSFYFAKYSLGLQTDTIIISIPNNYPILHKILESTNSYTKLPITQTSSYLNNITKELAKEGYSISTLKLENHQLKDHYLYTDLDIHLDTKRQIDQLLFTPYDNFPKTIKNRLLSKYKNKPFNETIIHRLEKEITQFPFIKVAKAPEVLFTQNNTAVYLYIDRQNISQFDGLIGFTNDDNGKVQFNGYADLQLMNILNKGEQLKLYWKNDGNQQTQFNFSTEVPYLFNTPFGIKATLELFKQDSTMLNTKFNASVLYYFNFNSRLGIGYQTTSSVAGKENFYNAANYNSNFLTLNYYNTKYQDHPLFRQKYYINSSAGIGSKQEEDFIEKTPQQFILLAANYLWQLNNRWYLNQQIESYFINSNTRLLYNEYYRFGGIHSIRGFRENTLLAKTQLGLYNEIRYLLAPNMYIHSISDIAYYEGIDTKETIYSFGLGFGIQTGGGLFNIIYANGVQPNSDFKLSNAIFHLSYKTQF